jgi:spermidine/putrescine transport system substrate-binding protein
MKKIFIRCCIVFLWTSLIACVLYLPSWKSESPEKETLNIFAWGDILDSSVIASFEEETGVKVNLSHYFSNEELIVKLKATGGIGYDLIIPSDYAVSILKNNDLIKKLDKTEFHYWQALNPALVGHPYDEGNLYSIPWEWELFGFGIDKEYFKEHPFDPSWKAIFDPNSVHYQITMTNDAIEAVEFAAFYLFGKNDSLSDAQLNEVKEVLKQQRNWVTAYANFRGDYFLATKTCPLILASSSYIWRTMRQFDFVGYAVPKEGSFISIENFCIPKATQKDALIYRFLNHIYTPESIATHYTSYGYFPSTLHALSLLEADPQAERYIRSTPEEFKKYHFLKRTAPQQTIRDIWVDVKS